jgi:DNA repair protein RecO
MDRIGIEGLVLKKLPMKDNDLIVSVLTRGGAKASIYSYGGQSSRKGKSSLLDVGLMNCYEVVAKGRMLRLEEVTSIWQHQAIRHDFTHFSMLCFACELIEIIALPYDKENREQNTELFKVMSNFIFHLDSSNKEDSWKCLFLFLVQLMNVEGVFPDLHHCVLTGESIENFACSIYPAQGGFALNDALSVKEGNIEHLVDDRMLKESMEVYQKSSFKKLSNLTSIQFVDIEKLLFFYCFQQHIEMSYLKSFQLLKDLPH